MTLPDVVSEAAKVTSNVLVVTLLTVYTPSELGEVVDAPPLVKSR